MRVLTSLLATFACAAVASAAPQFTTAQKTTGTPAAKSGVPSAAGYQTPNYLVLFNADDCASPAPIAGQGSFPFDSTAATTGTAGQAECGSIGKDVWFLWTADANGTATLDTCSTATFDTKLAGYPDTGGCPINGSSLGCNDDTTGCAGFTSRIVFSVTNGTSYLVQVGGFSSSSGTGTLNIAIVSPPAEDDCGTPAVIAGQGNFPFATGAATTGSAGQIEALCYFFSNTGISNDVWYSWTADISGTATVTTCLLTTVDTKISAYPGTGCPADGTSIACNDDACGLQSTIAFPVNGGTTYTLQLGSFPSASGGTGSFDISIVPPPISAYCFGDGSGTPCPCTNESTLGSGEGCANASGAGSQMTWTGSNSIVAGDLVFSANNLPLAPGNFALFFQGAGPVNGGNGIAFGDGLRCANSTVVRLELVPTTGGTASTTVNLASTGGAVAGTPLYYQCWYRSPLGPCASSFNFSNAAEVNWVN